MKIELHILQNFAPSNLNRDDTGAPKDCVFGGYRRARISSQCIKRSIRQAFDAHGLVPEGDMAARTKRLVERVAEQVAKEQGRDREQALGVTRYVLEGAGLGVTDELKTEYLLYVPRRHVTALAELIQKHWEELAPAVQQEPPPEGEGAKKTKKKSEKKAAFPKEVATSLRAILADSTKSPDLAMFGRMIADAPQLNVEAACQVAHALSTNRMAMEFDFYTAVDDFKPGDTAGSDMMGTIQFNSACFYRYSVLDTAELARNLGDGPGAEAMLRLAVNAFLRASVLAVPTGKQNGMAAHNPPSYVLALLRDKGAPVSLSNAFLEPVRAQAGTDLMSASILALEDYLQRVSRMYGTSTMGKAVRCADRKVPAVTDAVFEVVDKPDIDTLVDAVLQGGLGATP